MRNTFIRSLELIANEDPRVILITGDLGFGVLDRFKEQFPDQFINAGVAEQNMTALATGLALEGRIAFTYSIANFPTMRCLEQIRNDACYHNANVKIVSIGGGFSYGALGISHHATEDLAIMRSIPDITVVSPCGLWETEQASRALVETSGTCYLRLDKSFGNDAPIEDSEIFQLGRARVLKKGSDITIFVTGGILDEVEKVSKILENNKISTQIVSVHTIKPLDKELILEIVEKTKFIAVVEEHTTIGGLSGAIAETLVETGVYPEKFLRFGLNDKFSSIVGSQQYLRQQYGLDSTTIANTIKKQII
jgi:transketolase